MDSAVSPKLPFPPMEAELVRELPVANGWQYEPKWDGFRGILENVGGTVNLWSRNARPLLRYFPELEELGERLPRDRPWTERSSSPKEGRSTSTGCRCA